MTASSSPLPRLSPGYRADRGILAEGLSRRQASGAGDGGLGRTLRAGPQTDQALLECSWLRSRLTLAGNELRAGNIFIPRVRSADGFNVRILLFVGTHALDLRPPSGHLVVGLHAILRDRAGLTVHWIVPLAAVVERFNKLGLSPAPQHAHVPGPVEEDRFQVLGSGFRRKGSCVATAATCASTLRRLALRPSGTRTLRRTRPLSSAPAPWPWGAPWPWARPNSTWLIATRRASTPIARASFNTWTTPQVLS